MNLDLADRITILVGRRGMNKTLLARTAGVHRNTLTGHDRPDWNPTKTTRAKLKRAIAQLERVVG